MKIVFLEDVPNVGTAGQIKDVADGYAMNFLLPRKLAEPATEAAMKRARDRAESYARKRDIELEEKRKLAHQLDGLVVNFKRKVTQEKRLFGTIRDVQIAQAIKKLTGVAVDKGSLEIKEPIRDLGEHEIVLRLGGDVSSKIRVVVEEGDDK
jgi:large subunit ribosomal protein L9